MGNSFIESSWAESDQPFEIPLRPQTLNDFVGQTNVRKRLEDAAKQRPIVFFQALQVLGKQRFLTSLPKQWARSSSSLRALRLKKREI